MQPKGTDLDNTLYVTDELSFADAFKTSSQTKLLQAEVFLWKVTKEHDEVLTISTECGLIYWRNKLALPAAAARTPYFSF